eukprot:gene7970-16316_t
MSGSIGFTLNATAGVILLLLSIPIKFLMKSLQIRGTGNGEFTKKDLRGKIAIVTGSNTGIGKRTAANLSKMGAICVLACRDSVKGREAENDINKEVKEINTNEFPHASSGSAMYLHLDLNSLESVYTFVEELQKNFTKIDILINNAGLNASGTSSDGLNTLFQVNYLGHFLLFCLIKPLLNKNARVVNLSSVMHHYGDSDFRSSAYTNKSKLSNFTPRSHYSDSKLYMNFLTMEINRRFYTNDTSYQSILAVSVNPGAVRSDIWRFVPFPFFQIYQLLMRLLYLSVEQGCMTTVMGAILTPEEIENRPKLRNSSNIRSNNEALKLLPYLVPYSILPSVLAIATEVVGTYAGPQWGGTPTLPPNAIAVAQDLWNFSGMLCIAALSRRGVRNVEIPE